MVIPNFVVVGATLLGGLALSWVGSMMLSSAAGAAVMMAAPGLTGKVISRAAFEAAPKAYFSALHAGKLIIRGAQVFTPGM